MYKRLLYISLLLLSLLRFPNAFGQSNKYLTKAGWERIDTMRMYIEKVKVDTIRIFLLNHLCYLYIHEDKYKQADSTARVAIQQAERVNFTQGLASGTFNLGTVSEWRGNYKDAINYYTKSMNLYAMLGDSDEIAAVLKGLGDVYLRQGNYPMSLEMQFKALPLFEKKDNKHDESGTLLSIGNVYAEQEDYDNALKYYNKSLVVEEEAPGQHDIASIVGNIGDIEQLQKRFPEAIENSNKALQLFTKAGDKDGIIDVTDNLGEICFQQGNYADAMKYYEKGMAIAKEIDSKELMADNLVDIGKTYEKQKNYTEALDYTTRGLNLAKRIGVLVDVRAGEQILSAIYENIHNIPLAYQHYKAYIAVNDTLTSQDNARKLTRREMALDYEKKQALEKVEQDKKDAIAHSESKRQKMFNVFLSIIALAAGFIAIIIFRSLSTTRKQKIVIEEQKALVEEKNKNITDSINYAQRIQAAILAPVHEIDKALGDYFIFYSPKDIVSGDFYYVYEASQNDVVIAAVDCTGHGVPGAFMSMIGNDVLNQLVVEKKIHEPAQILSGMHDGVRFALRQADSGSKSLDGMDMALCRLNKKERHLQFSGAHRNLYILKKDGSALEIKGDKDAIGGVNSGIKKVFTNHPVQLEAGDTFYLFSDGFADQFGGDRGKKLTTKKFKEFITGMQSLPMKEQKEKLATFYESWKGSLEQIDDILVIGLRV